MGLNLDENMKFLPLIASLMMTQAAFAQSADPHSVFSLRGECEALSMGDEDLSHICSDEIMQVIYTNSMMELAIWTDDPSGRFLVFSGPVERTEAGLAQQVELVIHGKDGSGDNNVEHAATGLCTLEGDPSQGVARYTCDITDADGSQYVFAFATDGNPLENMLD